MPGAILLFLILPSLLPAGGTTAGQVRADSIDLSRGSAIRTVADSNRQSTSLVLFNQHFIEGLRSTPEAENVDAMFLEIFRRLPDTVRVFPSENYYYFIFYAAGRCFWGNFRLGVMERDSGMINFVYWEFEDNPADPDTRLWSKKFGPAEGVTIVAKAPFLYAVTAGGKTVCFRLPHPDRRPPRMFSLAKDEDFVFRTCDESGFEFFLLHKRTHPQFLWVLNEERGIPGILDALTDSILVDRTSGFAFYLDRARENRKILIGVRAQNVRRNNYWDGPFDQLADNDIPDAFAGYMEEVYPYAKGRIDRRGIFTDETGTRLAISPYMDYETEQELIDAFRDCARQPADEFYPCIAYDYKVHFRR